MRRTNSRIVKNARAALTYLKRPAHIVGNRRLWKNAKVSDAKLVFVVGAPRSGTTLVQVVVAAHSNFRSIQGETEFFTPKDLLDASRFEEFITPSEYRKCLQSSADIVTLFEYTYLSRFAPDVTPVEKTPQHVKRISFLAEHFPHASFINVFRDGRDCFVSGRRTGQLRSLPAYARYWRRCVEARMELGSHNRILDVRYEDLVTHPDAEVNRMMTFLDCQRAEQQTSSAVLGDDKRSCDKRFARLAKPIDASSVGQWRTAMSASETAAFERYAGEALKRLRYSPA